jgi:hypothetical protein
MNNESNAKPTVASEPQPQESEILGDFIFGKDGNGAHINIKGDNDHFDQINDEVDDDRDAALGIKDKVRLGVPMHSNLSKRRPKLPALSADEESKLIVAAQAGDQAAGETLYRHCEYSLQSYARNRWKSFNLENRRPEAAVDKGDFMSAANAAFCEAVQKWEPGHRFNSLWRHYVRGALIAASRDYRNAAGFKAETDAQRYLKSHPDANLLELEQEFPRASAAALRYEISYFARGNIATKYSEASNFDDTGEHDRDYSTPLGPIISGPEGGGISEETRALSQAPVCEVDFNVERYLGFRHGPGWVDDWAGMFDRWVTYNIRRKGRVRFAQELVERANPITAPQEAKQPPTPIRKNGAAAIFRVPSPPVSGKRGKPNDDPILLAA